VGFLIHSPSILLPERDLLNPAQHCAAAASAMSCCSFICAMHTDEALPKIHILAALVGELAPQR
jgi:hypothetical protein